MAGITAELDSSSEEDLEITIEKSGSTSTAVFLLTFEQRVNVLCTTCDDDLGPLSYDVEYRFDMDLGQPNALAAQLIEDHLKDWADVLIWDQLTIERTLNFVMVDGIYPHIELDFSASLQLPKRQLRTFKKRFLEPIGHLL